MKNIKVALSAVMLLSLVSAINGADSKCTKCAKCVVSKEAAEKKALESTREANAKEIKKSIFGVNLKAKPCKKKGCKTCKDYPTFKYSPSKKYMGALVTNAKENYIQVYNLDTKERVLYLIPSTKIRDISLTEDSVVIKWAGIWRTETTYSLGESCKKCKKTCRVGKVKKRRSLYGWAPCL